MVDLGVVQNNDTVILIFKEWQYTRNKEFSTFFKRKINMSGFNNFKFEFISS